MRSVVWIFLLCLGGFFYNHQNLLDPHLYAPSRLSLYEAQKQASQIDMYAMTTCGICKIMAQRLTQANIRFNEYYFDNDMNRKIEMVDRLRKHNVPLAQVRQAPIIFVGNQVFWGMTPISTLQAAMAK